MTKKHLFLWKGSLLTGLVLSLTVAIMSNILITQYSHLPVCKELHQVPNTCYALVLGTSPQMMNGDKSFFFESRVAAAAQLYHNKKVQYLLLSGGHDRQYYNEPLAMQQALSKLGVPTEAMILDIEGYNTLASVIRAKAVFNISAPIIVTQEFYGYRALYFSEQCGLQATLFVAPGAPPLLSRAWLREITARIKALIDLHLLKKHQASLFT